ncbi:hypothetical protein [Spiroplasma endosymbiont of Seladonia tumulorum]
MKKKKLNEYIINKLNQLMLRAYPVSKNDITDEYWAINKKN